MGWHNCEYCQRDGTKPATSSGDVTLTFANGRQYEVPDMLPHYVQEHGYCPPTHFIDDVLNTEFSAGRRVQTRSTTVPERIGYLSGEYARGEVPASFLDKLQKVMQIAAMMGDRAQTKGSAFENPPGARGSGA